MKSGFQSIGGASKEPSLTPYIRTILLLSAGLVIYGMWSSGRVVATLEVAPHHRLPNTKLVGKHSMVFAERRVGDQVWQLGCVPCFNAMTLIGYDGERVIALNGSTTQRQPRYSVFVDGKEIPWRPKFDPSLRPVSGELIAAAQTVKGCRMARHSVVDTTNALMHGICLDR